MHPVMEHSLDDGLVAIGATTTSCVALAAPVTAYLTDVIALCESANSPIVSVVLFGSAATGGYVEQSSDVDLLLVVRDDVEAEARDQLRDWVAKLEATHGLAKAPHARTSALARALTAFTDRVTANTRAFFICTRADVLRGDPSGIFDIPRHQAHFVDRAVIPTIVASGRTIWGEPLLDRVALPPIRRMDVTKACFGLCNQALLCAVMYPLLPRATRYAMDALKRSVHNCYFCHQRRTAPLVTEVAFFKARYGSDRTLERLVALRQLYRPSFGFVLGCMASIVRLHLRTALGLQFPRAAR